MAKSERRGSENMIKRKGDDRNGQRDSQKVGQYARIK